MRKAHDERVIAPHVSHQHGAAHSVIFGGFSADAIVDRVEDAEAKVLITCDGAWRRGRVVDLKGACDTAMERTDKIDHFLATGHSYWRWSHDGADPQRALRRGERTERTVLGRWTSGAFSYADLAANWDGYRFYDSLLVPGSPFQRSPEGCAVRVGTWDWAEWVATDWDELVNPSVYGRRIQRRIAEEVADDRDALCAQLPHPSGRNNIWLKKNPWFEAEVLPAVRGRTADLLGTGEADV